MSDGTGPRSGDALLRDAIEDVLRALGGIVWIVLLLSAIGMVLGFALMMNKMRLIGSLPTTLSEPSLQATLVFWVAALAASIALRLVVDHARAALARYVARRLAVPAVLATAQRAGRPETLSNEVIGNVETIRQTLAGPVAGALVAFIVSPLLVFLIALTHWVYGAITLFYCIAAGVLSWLVMRAAQRASLVSGMAQARAIGLTADAMRSGEAVLAMGMLPRLARQWIAVSTESSGEAWLAERRAERLKAGLELLMGSFRGAVIFGGAALALAGVQSNAAFAGSLFLISLVLAPFVGMGSHARELAEGLAAWRRMRTLVAGVPAPAEGIAFPCPHGRLVLEHMSFAFRGPAPALLRNIGVAVEPGEIVAVVGPSGSGKSTLFRLIMGIYRPSNGGIYLDGHATFQWDRRDFARHVGFLPQDPMLSRGTVAEVIARLEEPEMPLVLDAAKRAGAHELIVQLPLGYATPVAGNYQFSMGQRHRIALARALYGRPKLLVLDELAGALDAEGEAQVATLLAVLREEGTSVVFGTHRPRLLAAADRVFALRNGTLIPAGEEQPARLGGLGGPRPQRALA